MDQVTDNSMVNFSVAARYAAVEDLLSEVWRTIVRPLLPEIVLTDQLSVRLPARLLRLPVTTARSATSGESLVHLTEPTIVWPRSPGVVEAAPGSDASTSPGAKLVRIDGHFRDVATQVARMSLEPDTTVLAMGCRTAELVPMLAQTGAARAIVTSWDVEDRHCAGFGDELESRLRCGLSAAAALRSVQALRSSQHPYEWAGYSVVEFEDQERPSR